MKGLIIVNAYAKTKSELNQAYRLKEEFAQLNIDIDIIKNDTFSLYFDNLQLVNKLNAFDFCIYLDKDKYVLKILDKLGVKIFNNPNSIITCDDKFLTQIALANNDIKMPKTIPGVLCYYPDVIVKREMLDKIESEFSYPLVVKECYGSLGKGVFLCNNRTELEIVAEKVRLKPHIFQKFISSSYGTDIRIIVIGGQFVGAIKRQNSNDFRSNVELGGKGQVVQVNDDYVKTAEKVANILQLDYCGIDILIGENGEPVVCEVNSNAFFGAFEKITGINVAKKYAEYIIKKLGEKL